MAVSHGPRPPVAYQGFVRSSNTQTGQIRYSQAMARGSRGSSQRFRRPMTAQEAIVGEVRAMLVTGELQPGQPIPQEGLSEQLGVSPIPIREALKMLEGEGLISYIAHRGYFVRTLSVDDLHELFLMQRALETVALTEAVPQLTESDVQLLRDEAVREDEAALASDIVAFTRANRMFHFALLEPSRMPRLMKSIGQLWDAMDAYRSVYYRNYMDAWTDGRVRIRQEHDQMIKLAGKRDLTRLLSILDAHRAAAEREFERYFETNSTADWNASEAEPESAEQTATRLRKPLVHDPGGLPSGSISSP